jgi:PelA/Pel-15E family pectate lyase
MAFLRRGASASHTVFAAALYLGLISVVTPWWNVYEVQADEGFNLEKAALLSAGFRLYSDIWSDQPPFLTLVLSLVHDLFPFSIAAARAVAVAFSVLLLVCLFRVVRRFEGLAAAWAATLLLMLSKFYLQFSTGIMVGLPAVALIMLAFDILTGTGHRQVRSIAAGAFFALAFATKIFVVIVIPAMVVAAAFAGGTSVFAPLGTVVSGWRSSFKPMLMFLLGAAIVAIAMSVAFDVDPQQLLGTHLSARGRVSYERQGGVWEFCRLAWKFGYALVIAVVMFGFPAFIVRPTLGRVLPVLWIACAVVILGTHHPLWDHQILVALVPMAWLGGAGLKALFTLGARPRLGEWLLTHPDRRVVRSTWALVAFGWSIVFVATLVELKNYFNDFHKPPALMAQMARLDLALFVPEGSLILTDKAIDAYHHKSLVPPSLVVWSDKRRVTGQIVDEQLIDVMNEEQVSAVLMRRFDQSPLLSNAISAFGLEPDGLINPYSGANYRFAIKASLQPGLESRLQSWLAVMANNGIGGLPSIRNGPRLSRPSAKMSSPLSTVVARPPGSAQELGMCLLAGAQQSDSKVLFANAVAVGRSLYCTQTPGGGWRKEAVADGLCSRAGAAGASDAHATFDDGTLPSILYFAFALQDTLTAWELPVQPWLDDMIDKAFAFISSTQLEQGGWPQEVGSDGYHPLATLNDDAMTGIIRLLVAGYDRTGDAALLEVAVRGADYLLKVQGPPGQEGFAQQYSDDFKPAAARKFEPAGYSSRETAFAINALIDVFLATDEPRFKASAERAAEWLRAMRSPAGTWSRLYEVGTNRPIYGLRKGGVTYAFNHLPETEQKSYDWIGGTDVFPDIGFALQRVDAMQRGVDAVRDFDHDLAGRSWFAKAPTARLWLSKTQSKMSLPAAPSTRDFVKYCAGLVAEAQAEMPEPQ